MCCTFSSVKSYNLCFFWKQITFSVVRISCNINIGSKRFLSWISQIISDHCRCSESTAMTQKLIKNTFIILKSFHFFQAELSGYRIINSCLTGNFLFRKTTKNSAINFHNCLRYCRKAFFQTGVCQNQYCLIYRITFFPDHHFIQFSG